MRQKKFKELFHLLTELCQQHRIMLKTVQKASRFIKAGNLNFPAQDKKITNELSFKETVDNFIKYQLNYLDKLNRAFQGLVIQQYDLEHTIFQQHMHENPQNNVDYLLSELCKQAIKLFHSEAFKSVLELCKEFSQKEVESTIIEYKKQFDVVNTSEKYHYDNCTVLTVQYATRVLLLLKKIIKNLSEKDTELNVFNSLHTLLENTLAECNDIDSVIKSAQVLSGSQLKRDHSLILFKSDPSNRNSTQLSPISKKSFLLHYQGVFDILRHIRMESILFYISFGEKKEQHLNNLLRMVVSFSKLHNTLIKQEQKKFLHDVQITITSPSFLKISSIFNPLLMIVQNAHQKQTSPIGANKRLTGKISIFSSFPSFQADKKLLFSQDSKHVSTKTPKTLLHLLNGLKLIKKFLNKSNEGEALYECKSQDNVINQVVNDFLEEKKYVLTRGASII